MNNLYLHHKGIIKKHKDYNTGWQTYSYMWANTCL